MQKYTEIEDAPTFGLFHLSINDAAELIVMDMWFEAEISDIKEPDDWDGDHLNPILISALSGHAGKFKEKLIATINKGMLKPSVIKRDFDDQLIPEETYLHNDDVQDWLSERNYGTGDHWQHWLSNQIEIAEHLVDEVEYARSIINSGKKIPFKYPLSELELDEVKLSADAKLLTEYKRVVIENQELKEQLKNNKPSQKPNKADRPLTTRQRKTLLTIIAALCSSAKIDTQARGASQRIKELTESLGVPVDDETIRTLLSEIPDALEARMK